jgi:membrane-anchored protein YejM (alkaline phosphatase superfamily)
VADWIHDHRESPFFFFFHTFEAHSDFERLPYEAPGITRATVNDLFGISGYGCRGGACASQMLARINRRQVATKRYDPPVLRYLYHRGVEHVDAALGVLFDALRASGTWDNLLVVFTSDHGEEFFEHGGVLHNTLHEEIIHVPLFIKWPGGAHAGVRHPLPSSSIDVAPTLLEHVGLDNGQLPGAHLHRLEPDRAVFAGDFIKSVVCGELKGIFGGPKKLNRVYDLSIDPLEEHNLAPRRPQLRRQLRGQLRRQVNRDRRRYGVADRDPAQQPEVVLSEEEKQNLRALGYLD